MGCVFTTRGPACPRHACQPLQGTSSARRILGITAPLESRRSVLDEHDERRSQSVAACGRLDNALLRTDDCDSRVVVRAARSACARSPDYTAYTSSRVLRARSPPPFASCAAHRGGRSLCSFTRMRISIGVIAAAMSRRSLEVRTHALSLTLSPSQMPGFLRTLWSRVAFALTSSVLVAVSLASCSSEPTSAVIAPRHTALSQLLTGKTTVARCAGVTLVALRRPGQDMSGAMKFAVYDNLYEASSCDEQEPDSTGSGGGAEWPGGGGSGGCIVNGNSGGGNLNCQLAYDSCIRGCQQMYPACNQRTERCLCYQNCMDQYALCARGY